MNGIGAGADGDGPIRRTGRDTEGVMVHPTPARRERMPGAPARGARNRQGAHRGEHRNMLITTTRSHWERERIKAAPLRVMTHTPPETSPPLRVRRPIYLAA